jgi:hypothetical protein
MNAKLVILFLAVYEVWAMVQIVRLWSRWRKSFLDFIARVLFSIVLLVPPFGITTFSSIRSDAEDYADYVEKQKQKKREKECSIKEPTARHNYLNF